MRKARGRSGRDHETGRASARTLVIVRPKTPREKKRLSLEKDRRNFYGEDDKSSRKNIPKAKSRVNRANRRADSVALSGAVGVPDETVDTAAEDAVKGRRRKVWRKVPDESLGHKLARRATGQEPSGWDPSRRGWH